MGLGLSVFAAVALSAPGRIDVVDGYTRYDIGRSFVEHGDSIVRDRDAWFAVLPGRDGNRYSNYRFPQSAIAAAAILVSDATGPAREVRRHFFFSLSGAVLAAAIAVLYACWFRRQGHSFAASLSWAAGGVFCTPTWFYSTTSFDDVLGTLAVLAAVLLAALLSPRWPTAAASASGLLLGLAFNCKPPLALFLPVAIAAIWQPAASGSQGRRQVGLIAAGLALGVIVYKAYDLWKFPPSTWARLAEVEGAFVGLWPGNALAGLLSLLVSPGMGAIWYWPALIVALCGLAAWSRDARHRGLAWSAGLSAAAFLLFVSSIRFFSGEPAWGPRYLTPVFALLWIFVPIGLTRLGPSKSAALLAMSLAVQVVGLAADTMRFFSGEKASAAGRFLEDPWLYFEFGESQLLARPRQIAEILTYDGPAEPDFCPAASPTLPWYVFVVESSSEAFDSHEARRASAPGDVDLSNPVERLLQYVRTRKPLDPRMNHVLNSLRPWWSSYQYLPPCERPADLGLAAIFFLLVLFAGLTIASLAVIAEGICS